MVFRMIIHHWTYILFILYFVNSTFGIRQFELGCDEYFNSQYFDECFEEYDGYIYLVESRNGENIYRNRGTCEVNVYPSDVMYRKQCSEIVDIYNVHKFDFLYCRKSKYSTPDQYGNLDSAGYLICESNPDDDEFDIDSCVNEGIYELISCCEHGLPNGNYPGTNYWKLIGNIILIAFACLFICFMVLMLSGCIDSSGETIDTTYYTNFIQSRSVSNPPHIVTRPTSSYRQQKAEPMRFTGGLPQYTYY
jgi:hypothetical protein